MKCPKCGYMSFDFNETCPKCQRNIVSEREKMNHLSFMPEPPFLLATLLAQTGDSQVGMELSESAIVAGSQEPMSPVEETSAVDIELETASPFGIDSEEAPSMDIGLDEIPPEEPVQEEAPLPIENLEFEREQEPPVEDELVEVSTGTYASPLDEETLSLELEDLLEADKESESVEQQKEPDDEALTVEMDTLEPMKQESFPEVEEPSEGKEPEEIFDSLDLGEIESVEDASPPDEDISLEPPVAQPLPIPAEPDELFSPEDLKGYKIGQFNILTPSSRSSKEKGKTPAGEAGSNTPPGAEGVWDEITKDLEDLEFDIDDS